MKTRDLMTTDILHLSVRLSNKTTYMLSKICGFPQNELAKIINNHICVKEGSKRFEGILRLGTYFKLTPEQCFENYSKKPQQEVVFKYSIKKIKKLSRRTLEKIIKYEYLPINPKNFNKVEDLKKYVMYDLCLTDTQPENISLTTIDKEIEPIDKEIEPIDKEIEPIDKESNLVPTKEKKSIVIKTKPNAIVDIEENLNFIVDSINKELKEIHQMKALRKDLVESISSVDNLFIDVVSMKKLVVNDFKKAIKNLEGFKIQLIREVSKTTRNVIQESIKTQKRLADAYPEGNSLDRVAYYAEKLELSIEEAIEDACNNDNALLDHILTRVSKDFNEIKTKFKKVKNEIDDIKLIVEDDIQCQS